MVDYFPQNDYKYRNEYLNLRRSPYLPQMQLTTLCHCAPHLLHDVIKSKMRVPNLTRHHNFLNAPHQPFAHGAPHLLHDVIKSKMRLPNLTNHTFLRRNSPTNGAHHLPQDVTKIDNEYLILRRSTYSQQMHLTNPMPIVLITFYMI